MYNKTSLVLAILLLHLSTFGQRQGPSIEEIADKFYNTYATGENSHYSFERRADVWRIGVKKWEGNHLLPAGRYLFFDSDSGGYQHIPLPVKPGRNPVDFHEYIDDYQLAGYHIHAYYGYDGWYKDVIAALSRRRDDLSDSSLNSLARAYSNYASCMLTEQSGDCLKSDLLNLPLARNCMTAAQVEQYHEIESRAIQTFGRLSQLNPNFQTIVGSVPIKYGNEIMVEYYTYLTFADNFARTFELPDHLYSDTIIAKARKVLEKCPPDAILLSLGDNDFYPILYAQAHLHVRTDVRLINRNLIGVDHFLFMTGQPQFQSKPINLNLTPEYYIGTTNDFLSLKSRPAPAFFSELRDTLRSGLRDEYGALTLPSQEFIIRRTSASTVDSDTLHFRLPVQYILKADWVFLLILDNLNGRRVACETPLDGMLAPLNAYFVQKDSDLFVY